MIWETENTKLGKKNLDLDMIVDNVFIDIIFLDVDEELDCINSKYIESTEHSTLEKLNKYLKKEW